MSSGSISELQVVDFTGAKGLENQLYWSILSKNGREPAGIRTKASRERSCGTGNRKKAPARYACRATAQSACSTQPEVAVIQPKLTLIAGANGSGKTTLTRWNAGLFKDIPVLDPDSIGKPLQPTASIAFPIEGARQVLRSANGHLHRAESFAVETTLSGKSYLRTMLDAHRFGFEIVLVYIGTNNVETNLARIRARVLAGGHDVPEADVRRRYGRSLANLALAVKRADHTILFDNSTEEGYRLVAIFSPTGNRWLHPRPAWASAVA
jgi:predicted ABC-type ATPase